MQFLHMKITTVTKCKTIRNTVSKCNQCEFSFIKISNIVPENIYT